MNTGPTLIIVCGLPGAGKTMHGQFLAEELGAIRFSPDEWMESLGVNLWDENARAGIEALQRKLARDLLRLGQNVIIEWGTWAKAERAALRDEAQALGASVELHYLEAPIGVLWERIQGRNAESPPIQKGDLERWFEEFEVPNDDETTLYDSVYRTSA